MSAGRNRLLNVPAIDVAGKEVGIGNPGDLAIEFKMTRIKVSPARVVLIESVVLAAKLNGVLAVD